MTDEHCRRRASEEARGESETSSREATDRGEWRPPSCWTSTDMRMGRDPAGTCLLTSADMSADMRRGRDPTRSATSSSAAKGASSTATKSEFPREIVSSCAHSAMLSKGSEVVVRQEEDSDR